MADIIDQLEETVELLVKEYDLHAGDCRLANAIDHLRSTIDNLKAYRRGE